MTPSINVNLKPCPVARAHEYLAVDALHGAAGCPASVLIPCPIPRSVTFSVELGACALYTACGPDFHARACPALPIRVSCSISGKTWEESEVVADFEHPSMPVIDSAALLMSVRDRWALVKALVLGQDPFKDFTKDGEALVAQRDAVFAALADMARAEQDACNAQQRVDEAFPFDCYRRNDPDHRSERPSVGRLVAYIEYLIDQVGAL